jgi:protein-tyrosine-phosphatase
MNILFVCSGNISRSFLAQRLLEKELGSMKVEGVSVASAGLHAYPGNPPDPEMVDYLAEMGIPAGEHGARQIQAEDVGRADLIMVMERDHAKRIRAMWPEAADRVELLGSLMWDGPAVEDDIIDPFGKSPYHYRLAKSQITLAVKSLAARLAFRENREPQ